MGGALICLLIYLIGRRVADEVTGLVGAALAAVYGYFIYYSVALMTETFFIVLVLLTLYLSLELKEKPTLNTLGGARPVAGAGGFTQANSTAFHSVSALLAVHGAEKLGASVGGTSPSQLLSSFC